MAESKQQSNQKRPAKRSNLELICEPCTPKEESDSNNATSGDKLLCKKCNKKQGRRACLEQACLNCCSDVNCPAHLEGRQQRKQRTALLEGTSEISILAAQKRELAVQPGVYKEASFRFMGETLTIWNLTEFFANTKWRDDALRKSKQRNSRSNTPGANNVLSKKKNKGSSRKRFKTVMEDLLEKSLMKSGNSP